MSRTSITFCLLAVASILSCQPQNPAKTIIDQSIAAHGGDAYRGKRISFDFRKYHIVLEQKDGQFRYERSYPDSTGTIVKEVLTNDSFVRTLNNQPQTLDTAQLGKYSRAVNSVAYFVLLPNKLADSAVQPDLMGEAQINDQQYDKVRVRFRAEGGGNHYGDTFFFWFNQKTHTMDYLSYSDGGPRFRKAINPTYVGGIRFQDYINYKGEENDTTSVGNYDRKYKANALTELSRIEQTNIRVEDLP